MSRSFSNFLSILATVLLTSFSPAETKKENFPGAIAEIYKQASGDELYLYLFNPEAHDASKDQRPAIVFFFGGGWNGGTPSQFVQHSEYLASRGMVAVVADYRVKSRQNTTAKECVADGKSAVRFLRENAVRLGIDPNRIAAGGGSAGGHVAAAAGMLDNLDDPAESNSKISSKPNLLALFNPVYDNGPDDGWGHNRVIDYWQDISPAHNISKDDPPAIVFLGDQDDLIPVKVAERFQENMKKVGLDSELHVYGNQRHGFFNESKGGTETFLDTLEKLDAFLVKHTWLSGEGTEAQRKAVSKPAKKKKQ